MAQLQTLPSTDKRSVFVVGDQPYNRDRVIKESLEAGLQVVITKLVSDHSETILPKIQHSSGDGSEPHATEILPDEASAISNDTLARLREHYGDNCCVLPLNDYVTEYAAAISSKLSRSCFPPRSAEIVKCKHQLRDLWNHLAAQPDSGLASVEYCYLERSSYDDNEFVSYPSAGFNNLPENTPLIVKPDELSSSIEVHYASSKQEAMSLANSVCEQLQSKWYEVGRSIGTEVRPRVVVEMAIQRSKELHPGAEFSIEFVSFEGKHYPIGITQKWIAPNFIETGQLFPAESFPERLRPALEDAVQQLLDGLDVGYCVSHWEFIITPEERIALVEGHLRPAGDRIMELIEHSTNHSPTAALCEALAQQKVDFSFAPQTSCGIFWLIPETPLTKVTEVTINRDVTDALTKDLYVNEEGILATPGWSEASDWLTRFAHVMATGKNVSGVINNCREVARNVTLTGYVNDTPTSTTLKLAIDQ
jgi:hypothetical protein